jgi:hypothetical protein
MKMKTVSEVLIVYGVTNDYVEQQLYTTGVSGVEKILWADPSENNGLSFCKVYVSDEIIFISNPTKVFYSVEEEN